MNARKTTLHLLAASLAAFFLCPSFSQNAAAQTGDGPAATVPDLNTLLSKPDSRMAIVRQRYIADRGGLNRMYPGDTPSRFARMQRFYESWVVALQKLDSSKFSGDEKTDLENLAKQVQNDIGAMQRAEDAMAAAAPAVPFADAIYKLDDQRHDMQKPDPIKAGGVVDSLAKQVAAFQKTVEGGGIHLSKEQASLDAARVVALRGLLREWYGFYNDYDPLFTWWLAEPEPVADKAITDYANQLRGIAGESPLSDENAGRRGGRGGRGGGGGGGRGGAGAFAGNDNGDGSAQESAQTAPIRALPPLAKGVKSDTPDLVELMGTGQSEMRGVLARAPGGGGRGGGRGARGGGAGNAQIYDAWLAALAKLDFNSLSHAGQVDYLLLKNRIQYSKDRLAIQGKPVEEVARFLPFQAPINNLVSGDSKPSASDAVSALNDIKQKVADAQKVAESPDRGAKPFAGAAVYASRQVKGLQTKLQGWYSQGQSSDSSWGSSVADADKSLDKALTDYTAYLRHASGADMQHDGLEDIVEEPVGRADLAVELENEMIIYSPEELLALGQKQYDWCENEMKKASRQLGYGDDWHKALEHVKEDHVPAGDQPYMIRDLAWDAISYIEKHDMITVPQVCEDTWGMIMMTPQRQLVNPFFTGGTEISVSYPTSTMTQQSKLESMRGNNNDFARATVFHELIPGHNMQGFMNQRYTTHRGFSTSFWSEGSSVYWEFLMYAKGYQKTPENKIGAMFWRMHRAARIIFSLNYQMGRWTSPTCVNFLVDAVGHERENATAEVRRSFDGSYNALYQAGYMMGALQLFELHHELVDSHKMTERAFNDAIMHGGSMPIAMVKANITPGEKLTADYKPGWRF